MQHLAFAVRTARTVRVLHATLNVLGYIVVTTDGLPRTLRIDTETKSIQLQPDLTVAHTAAALEVALRFLSDAWPDDIKAVPLQTSVQLRLVV